MPLQCYCSTNLLTSAALLHDYYAYLHRAAEHFAELPRHLVALAGGAAANNVSNQPAVLHIRPRIALTLRAHTTTARAPLRHRRGATGAPPRWD